MARLLRLPLSACVSRIAKPAGIELACIRLFLALLASICSRPNSAKRCDGPCSVRRSSSYPSGRKGASGYTGGRKRENTIRQGARCISDMHAVDPKAAQAIVTQVTLSGFAAGCPSWSTWRAAGLRCLQPQTGIAFECGQSVCGADLCRRRCQANDVANCLRTSSIIKDPDAVRSSQKSFVSPEPRNVPEPWYMPPIHSDE